ncbi:MAG: hypothetical protein RL737_181 [Bacteroidota bacterium]|jgi:hypothetical protein
MIYKFYDIERDVTIEFELINDNTLLSVSICSDGASTVSSMYLDKKDLYKLIGALHLVQKEMK